MEQSHRRSWTLSTSNLEGMVWYALYGFFTGIWYLITDAIKALKGALLGGRSRNGAEESVADVAQRRRPTGRG